MTANWQRRNFLLTTAGALGYLSLPGCGGSNDVSSAPAPTTAATTQEASPMFSVISQMLAGIRARPETFLDVYGGLRTNISTPAPAYVRSVLGAAFSSLTDAGSLAIFASAVAFNAAPIGATSLDPQAATLTQLLSSANLTCGHYAKLATLFTLLRYPGLVPPDATPPASKPTIHFLVWLGNVPLNTGFHAQLIITNAVTNGYLLLDPTYGYAINLPFVGSGPQAELSVVDNAATMLQTPIPQNNLTVLEPSRVATMPEMLQTVMGGGLGPQYVYHDSIYGCEGWDNRIAQIIDNFG